MFVFVLLVWWLKQRGKAGCARPWASSYYARLLASLDVFSFLSSEFAAHQCKSLVNSKSTSKRLLAAHFLSLHVANLKVSFRFVFLFCF